MIRDNTTPEGEPDLSTMPEQWNTVIAGMVYENLKISEAMRKAKYKEGYIKADGPSKLQNDPRFSKALALKRAENEQETKDDRDKCLERLDSIILDAKATNRDVIRAVEVRGKMCGWMSERIVHETVDRQRQLDESKRAEVARLAALRLDTTKQIESRVIENSDNETKTENNDDM